MEKQCLNEVSLVNGCTYFIPYDYLVNMNMSILVSQRNFKPTKAVAGYGVEKKKNQISFSLLKTAYYKSSVSCVNCEGHLP